MTKTITFITGGVRSGKSRYALELARARSAPYLGATPVYPAGGGRVAPTFVATAQPFDGEMESRIARHRVERGEDFSTLEEPLYLAQALTRAAAQTNLILVDCVTLWVNNLLYQFAGQPAIIQREIQSFLGVVGERRTDLILVTNEIGWGVTPQEPLARWFLEEHGRLNQELACLSDEVILMVSGIPQWIKGAGVASRLDSPL